MSKTQEYREQQEPQEKLYYKFVDVDKDGNLFRRDFQYKIGLNILDKPFEEEGDCAEGGLYFADEANIKHFIGAYGSILCVIKIPENAKVVKNPNKKNWTDNSIKYRVDKLEIVSTHKLFDGPEFFEKFPFMKDLSEAYLSMLYLSGVDLSGVNLYKADLSGAILSRVNLSGAILSRSFVNLFQNVMINIQRLFYK